MNNNNSHILIIDDNEDILFMLKTMLQLKGYKIGEDIGYIELREGRHDIATWSRAMPLFLKWGWSRKQSAVSS